MFAKITFTLAAALALCCMANAQSIGLGSCPKGVTVIPNFNIPAYMGDWYEYAKYDNFFERNAKCITATYTLNADGNVDVDNKQISTTTGEPKSIEGTAYVVENAKLRVVFAEVPFTTEGSNYMVLDTDYKNYSVVYSCSDVLVSNAKFVWILTRQRFPSDEIISIAKSVLTKNGISLKDLTITVQTGCDQ